MRSTLGENRQVLKTKREKYSYISRFLFPTLITVFLIICFPASTDTANNESVTDNSGMNTSVLAVTAFEQAVILHTAGNYQEAIATYRKAIELDPTRPAFHKALGYAYRQTGDYPSAKEAFHRAYALNRSDYEAGYQTGLSLFQLSEYTRAGEVFREIARTGDPVPALVFRGISLYIQERNEEAESVFNEVLTRDPDNLLAQYWKAQVLAVGERYEEAIGVYQHAISRHPSDPLLYTGLGDCLLATGGYTGAEEAYQKSLSLEENQPMVLLGLGIVSLKNGDLREAEERLKRSLEINPDNPLALYNLGQVYIALGEDTKAKEVLNQKTSIS